MNSKPEYINLLAKLLKEKCNLNEPIDMLNHMIQNTLEHENIILCKSEKESNITNRNNIHNPLENYTRDNDDDIVEESRRIEKEEMFYTTIQGHVYLMNKNNMVFTCNKENPIEIGKLDSINGKHIIKYHEGMEQY
jgi:hypothetical protein